MSRAALIGIMLIIGIHAFDELVLIISLPEIAAQLLIDKYYGLTITAYILAAITGMSSSGSYIDAIGPRKVLVTGSAIFFVGIVQAVFAWDGLSFICARILQGLGGGIMITCAFALINLLSTPETKSKAITSIDVAWVIPSLSAPLLGGFIVEHLSWRWIFIVQIPPIALIIFLVVSRVRHLDLASPLPNHQVLIDGLRVATGLGIFFLILAEPISMWWILLIPALLISIPSYNRVMPEKWYIGGTRLSLPILVGMLSFVSFYGLEAFQPLYLIQEVGLSTIHAGLIVTSASASWLIGSHIASLRYKYNSTIAIMLFGNCILFAGVVALAISTYFRFPVIWLYPSWALAGLGMGFCFNAVRTSAMENTPKNKEGFVATAITLSVNMGIGISAGVGGALKNRVGSEDGTMLAVLLAMICVALVVSVFNLILLLKRKMMFERQTL